MDLPDWLKRTLAPPGTDIDDLDRDTMHGVSGETAVLSVIIDDEDDRTYSGSNPLLGSDPTVNRMDPETGAIIHSDDEQFYESEGRTILIRTIPNSDRNPSGRISLELTEDRAREFAESIIETIEARKE